MTASRIQTFFLGIIVVFLMGMFLREAKQILFPFFLAVFISIFQTPIINFFHKFKIPRFISSIIVLLVTAVILYLLGSLFVNTGKAFVEEVPKYSDKVESVLEGIQKLFRLSPEQWNPKELVKKIDISQIGSVVLTSIGAGFSFLAKFFLVIIFLIFILTGKGRLRKKLSTHLQKSQSVQITTVIDNIDQEIEKYLAVKTLISFFTGFFVTVVLLIFGVDFALFFGLITFALNYIPQLGSLIATVLPVVIAIFQFPSIWPAIWILILLLVIQNIMGGIIEPKMMGEGLGLSPLVVLFSLFFWYWLWGVEGMILAIPLTSSIKIISRNIPSTEFIAILLRKA